MTPTVLFYNLPGEISLPLSHLCTTLNLTPRPVSPLEQGLPIGVLLGLLPPAKHALEQVPGPMVVFCHLSPSQVDALLDNWKAQSIPPVPCRALLTPSNLTWPPRRLYTHLAQEHAALTHPPSP